MLVVLVPDAQQVVMLLLAGLGLLVLAAVVGVL